MFEIATLTPNHTVQLLPEIAKQFLPKNRFIVWWEGDTLHLRRLPPRCYSGWQMRRKTKQFRSMKLMTLFMKCGNADKQLRRNRPGGLLLTPTSGLQAYSEGRCLALVETSGSR